MGGRGAEMLTPGAAGMVQIGAGIDQYRAPIDMQLEGQGVRMTVGGNGKIAQGAMIHDP